VERKVESSEVTKGVVIVGLLHLLRAVLNRGGSRQKNPPGTGTSGMTPSGLVGTGTAGTGTIFVCTDSHVCRCDVALVHKAPYVCSG
jgi:hypothetical protein